MKAVLISIRPEWCAKITSGEKKIEVRKSRPKLPPPFKVYIYCTKDVRKQFWTGPRYSYVDDHSHNAFDKCGSGKVVGEFVCDRIYQYSSADHLYGVDISHKDMASQSCLTRKQIEAYELKNAPEEGYGYFGVFGWHISGLKIYDEPRELRQFVKPYDAKACLNPTVINCGDCKKCYLTRAPQSWCYVEETDNDKT